MDNQSTKHGNIQKCPQCGAPVEPMAVKCSECGYEFRNVEALMSSQRLAEKLDEIAKSYRGKGKRLFQMHDNQIYMKQEQATAIANFPIPTTKEDLFDFSITMQSRWRSATSLDEGTGVKSAYKAKYNECVNKAKILFPNDPMFQGIFEQSKADKKKFWANMSTTKKLGLFLLLLLLIWIVGIAIFINV